MRFHAPFAALLAIAAPAPAARPNTTAHYINPVIDQDFPDPAVIRARDGAYYVYATQSAGEGSVMHNLQVARSRDLVHWALLGDALPVKPAWASRTQDFWAPDVIADHGRYILYYSAKPDTSLTDEKAGLCLGVATSRRPEGPFVDSGRPLQCGPGFENIDPMAFDDPATGRHLLYWGSGFQPIKVRELARDRLSFAPGSTAKPLLFPVKSDDPGEYRHLLEGAWITRHGGTYYLFASGDNCCGAKAHYAVLVARSRSATGPFTMRPRPYNLVVEAGNGWVAPGHNSVIRDSAGTEWLLYHGVDAKRPRSHSADDVNTRRVMLLDRLVWRNGWPEVRGKRPSHERESAPN